MDYTTHIVACKKAQEQLQRFLKRYEDPPLPDGEAMRSLFEERSLGVVRREWATGGKTMDRGYYCPSTVRDLVVVGQNRGKLLHRPKTASAPSFCYGFDGEGRLLTVLTLKEQTGEVVRREVLFYDRDVQYGVAANEDGREVTLCVCRYGQGGLLSYRLYFLEEGAGVNRFFAEDYERDLHGKAQVTFYEFFMQDLPEKEMPLLRLIDHRRYDCTVQEGVLVRCLQTDYDKEGNALPPFSVHIFKRAGREVVI